MRATEFLIEKILNLTSVADKEKIAPLVWDILQRSYQDIGGFKSASSPEELIHTTGLWKIVTRAGRPTAAAVYKDQYGRKGIGAGSDGSYRGKKDFIMLKKGDARMNRAWIEASGKVESIMIHYGAKPIPSKYAALLTHKEILEYDPDGVHYTRLIAGSPHKKAIYGVVNLSPEDVEKFKKSGISLTDLPQNLPKPAKIA